MGSRLPVGYAVGKCSTGVSVFLGPPSEPERNANVCSRLPCLAVWIVFISRTSAEAVDPDF